MHGHFWWYVARSAGLTSWLLLTISTGFGIATATRIVGRGQSTAWTLAVHRFLGGLAVAFVGLHVLGIVADSYVHFRVVDVLVPFATSWHPAAVAWGIVGAWLLLAVELTSLVRNRLSQATWRWIHLTSYVLFFAATVHLFTAGTDSYGRWLRVVAIAGTGAIAFLSIGAALEGTATTQP